MTKFLSFALFIFLPFGLHGQINSSATDSCEVQNDRLDSLYIQEVEHVQQWDAFSDAKPIVKVLHAEPLYVDLIRDLGARRGEREWNVGLELRDNVTYDIYSGLIEYEFAPINRLGFEFEMPFAVVAPYKGVIRDSLPNSGIKSLKMATQYSFWVSDKSNLSMAVGYIHEGLMPPQYNGWPKASVLAGHVFNPFFVTAKRWGQNLHTLVYTGPHIEHVHGQKAHMRYDVNTSIHYMLDGTRNFIGLETNKQFENGRMRTVFRPQMRVMVTENLLIGIVVGVPTRRQEERLSSFIRLVYEPGHKNKHCPKAH